MARPVRIEWPEKERIAVVLQVPFEQYQRGGAHASKIHLKDLVAVPTLPEEVTAQGVPDLLAMSWDEYGERGLWRLTDLLNGHHVTATGVFSGLAVERYPEVVKAFRQGGGGREICAHSWAQDIQSYRLNREQMRENVRRCAEVITKVAGERPVGWVSPGGQQNEHTLPVLIEEGFLWHGDYASSDAPFLLQEGGKRMVGMAVPFHVNDTMYVRERVPPSHYVEMFCRSFDVLYEEGGQVIGAVAHATIYGHPFGTWAYDRVIKYAKGFSDVWFATRCEIAQWYLDHYA